MMMMMKNSKYWSHPLINGCDKKIMLLLVFLPEACLSRLKVSYLQVIFISLFFFKAPVVKQEPSSN